MDNLVTKWVTKWVIKQGILLIGTGITIISEEPQNVDIAPAYKKLSRLNGNSGSIKSIKT
jgi:hypothetical protein